MRISDWSSDVCSSDLPPAICFQRQPCSRLISRIFSVSASRFMGHLHRRKGTGRHECRPVVSAQAGSLNLAASSDPPVALPLAYLRAPVPASLPRSEEHTSGLQSLMRISYAVSRLQNKPQLN